MNLQTLRARWIIPIDGEPIEGGFVTIAGGRIVTVGARRLEGPIEELGDVAVLPGLVNAHTHLEFSDLAAPLGRPGMRLPHWIRLVIAQRKRGDHCTTAAIAAGLAESVAGGATIVGEISASAMSLEVVERGLPRPTIVAFQESIGFSGQRVESALADVVRRYELAPQSAGLSPHAPYTVHPRLLERIVDAAIARQAPVAMHLAESPEELELLATGGGPFQRLLDERSMWDAGAIPRGSRPLDALRQLARAARALVIHGNYLAEDEIHFLAARRQSMSVVFCPRTHAYFEHAPHPVGEMLAAGVRVGLGTDSRASNPDLSMLAELRFAARAFPQIAPAEWLRMATLEGAVSLGVGGDAGSLVAGKRADMVAIACDGPTTDPIAAVVAGRGNVERVWIAGQPMGLPS